MAPIMNVRTDGLLACFQDKNGLKKAIQGGPATKRRTPLSQGQRADRIRKVNSIGLPGTSQGGNGGHQRPTRAHKGESCR